MCVYVNGNQQADSKMWMKMWRPTVAKTLTEKTKVLRFALPDTKTCYKSKVMEIGVGASTNWHICQPNIQPKNTQMLMCIFNEWVWHSR